MDAHGSYDWPAEVHAVFRDRGLRHIASVPDAGLTRLLELCAADNRMLSIALTTEAEGIGVLAGAWLGGEKGALLMQSSGVGNCLNTFQLARICRFPLLMLVTMRGEWGEFNPWQVPMGQGTPSALELGGVIVQRPAEAGEIAATVDAAATLAYGSMCAVAVLISQRIVGAKSFAE